MASPLSVFRGVDGTFVITVTNPDGTPADLTNTTLTFLAKRWVNDADAAAIISKSSPSAGITITNPIGGLASLAIAHADTAALGDSTILYWGLKVVDVNGALQVINAGTLLVTAEAVGAG